MSWQEGIIAGVFVAGALGSAASEDLTPGRRAIGVAFCLAMLALVI